ncbi:MAG TPA: nucleotidyl transferase AbiEii/AbiGii toxin family protein [Solirubrobacterales bacterium]|nr:nucleotidyl transferase AbiEii/AbiGii toxin family protein [Solirubrobacterales bacterium]
MLERAAEELHPFLEEVAFVGGATIALWITDRGAPEPRVTKDVDLVVEVASRTAWYRFEERLRAHGLRNDASSPVICRWRAGSSGDELVIDVMPGDASILGFENRWQRPALDHAKTLPLPSGQQIRAISPPYLMATKLEAWNGRGRGDHLRSHDLEDIVTLVDGRAEVLGEVDEASSGLRAFLSREVTQLLEHTRFLDLIDGTVVGFRRGGSGGKDRADEIVLPRLRQIAGE